MSNSIGIVIPYFGRWPSWIEFFLESCRANRSVNWILVSDLDPPENQPRNVRHVRIGFDEYRDRLSDAFGTSINLKHPYKLCDFKPALPYVHRDLMKHYHFVGFGDLDVIYGDIRSFYDDRLLAQYDMLSTHRDRVSGHLFLMRNSERNITAFQRTPGWKDTLRREDYAAFDERRFFNSIRSTRARLLDKAGIRQPRGLFGETYSTPAATNHMRWYWEGGRLTNEYYPHHPFMYLHFMSWHSTRWLASQEHVEAGAAAPWARLGEVVQMDWRDARKDGFMISPQGIQRIEWPRYP